MAPIFLAEVIHVGFENVLSLVCHPAGDLHGGDQVIHPVQGLQEGGLAAAGGADQGGNGFFGDLNINMLQSLGLAVPEIQVIDSNDGFVHGSLLYTRFS